MKKVQIATITPAQNRLNLSQNQFPIALKYFSSDNIVALNGFLNLVKSEEYPTIIVQLNYLQLENNLDKIQPNSAKANLNFTITGVTKAYNIPIMATHLGDQYQINGNIKINIRDFGLVPPEYMMGLVKVNEWIDIEFHMICKITLLN